MRQLAGLETYGVQKRTDVKEAAIELAQDLVLLVSCVDADVEVAPLRISACGQIEVADCSDRRQLTVSSSRAQL